MLSNCAPRRRNWVWYRRLDREGEDFGEVPEVRLGVGEPAGCGLHAEAVPRIGFDGKFGQSSWTWDGYYQYGLTNREQIVNDNRHLNAYNFAIDSLFGSEALNERAHAAKPVTKPAPKNLRRVPVCSCRIMTSPHMGRYETSTYSYAEARSQPS